MSRHPLFSPFGHRGKIPIGFAFFFPCFLLSTFPPLLGFFFEVDSFFFFVGLPPGVCVTRYLITSSPPAPFCFPRLPPMAGLLFDVIFPFGSCAFHSFRTVVSRSFLIPCFIFKYLKRVSKVLTPPFFVAFFPVSPIQP